MHYQKQLAFLDAARRAGAPLVLATVYETSGSTYSKAGARMLVDGEGRFRGMLSGGCLEGDLAMRARVAIESGEAQFAEYDLTDDNDELWGMGVGCEGTIRVLLQPLSAASGYEPATTLLARQAGRTSTRSLTCVHSEDPDVRPGATLIVDRQSATAFGLASRTRDAVVSETGGVNGRDGLHDLDLPGGRLTVLSVRVPQVPRLLVLGAGPDAEPVVRFAAELGWFCTVFDHRPAYVDNNDFPAAVARVSAPAAELMNSVTLADYDLAIVMSHHLASDREYLRQLATTEIGYVGLLGPPSRRARLLSDLGETAESLAARLSGPAGLDLGGRGPAPIALSIVAEMQAWLAKRSQAAAAPSEGRPGRKH